VRAHSDRGRGRETRTPRLWLPPFPRGLVLVPPRDTTTGGAPPPWRAQPGATLALRESPARRQCDRRRGLAFGPIVKPRPIGHSMRPRNERMCKRASEAVKQNSLRMRSSPTRARDCSAPAGIAGPGAGPTRRSAFPRRWAPLDASRRRLSSAVALGRGRSPAIRIWMCAIGDFPTRFYGNAHGHTGMDTDCALPATRDKNSREELAATGVAEARAIIRDVTNGVREGRDTDSMTDCGVAVPQEPGRVSSRPDSREAAGWRCLSGTASCLSQ